MSDKRFLLILAWFLLIWQLIFGQGDAAFIAGIVLICASRICEKLDALLAKDKP